MGRMRVLRQGDLLALMEPGPTLTPTIRATLVPLVAALLLEAVHSGTTAGANATTDTRTMRWWSSQPAAWEACRTDPEVPASAMGRFHAWLQHQHDAVGLPVMVAFPAAYDAMWIQWYLRRFVGDDPFRRRAIDVKTLAMVAIGAGYRATTKSSLPRHWRPAAKHTHVAVDDAVEQGELFVNIVRQLNVHRGEVALARLRQLGVNSVDFHFSPRPK